MDFQQNKLCFCLKEASFKRKSIKKEKRSVYSEFLGVHL
jgi:hypothetical protein